MFGVPGKMVNHGGLWSVELWPVHVVLNCTNEGSSEGGIVALNRVAEATTVYCYIYPACRQRNRASVGSVYDNRASVGSMIDRSDI